MIVAQKVNKYHISFLYVIRKLVKGIIFKIIQPLYPWRRKCSRSRISTFAILRINEMS